MKQRIKSTIVKVMVCGLFVFVFNVKVFSLIIVNGSESCFAGPERIMIRDYVIEAAGYFLDSQSDFLLFSNKIELSGIQGSDYNELRGILNRSITKLKSAKSKYEEII